MPFSKLRFLDRTLTLAAIALTAGSVLVLGPSLETKLFPVYSKFEIVKIDETPSGGSRVVFKYFKLRDCQPAGFMWFIGEPGAAFRQVDILSARPPGVRVNRPIGENTSVPYEIDVPPNELLTRGFATIYNNCHPLWVTRSVIYP